MRLIALVTALVVSYPPYSPFSAIRCEWFGVKRPDVNRLIRAIIQDDPMRDDLPPADIHPPIDDDDQETKPENKPDPTPDPDGNYET